jgi:hypothetical protein
MNNIDMLNKQKKIFFLTEGRKVMQVLYGGWNHWKGEDIRKGWRRVNMVEILCTHIRKRKNEMC